MIISLRRFISLVLLLLLSGVTTETLCVKQSHDRKTVSKDITIKVAVISGNENYSYILNLERELNSYGNEDKKYEVRGYESFGAGVLRKYSSFLTKVIKGEKKWNRFDTLQSMAQWQPDIVLLDLGREDALNFKRWDAMNYSFTADYIALLDSVKKILPKSEYILINPMPVFAQAEYFNTGVAENMSFVRKSIEELSVRMGVRELDLYTPFRYKEYLFEKGISLTEKGKEMVAKEIASNITGNFGGLSLAGIYSNGAVLQRDEPLKIKGRADALTEIEVVLDKISLKTKTNLKGDWEVEFKPFKASFNPVKLIVKAKEQKIEIDSLLFGDVWLCSGQSNMEWVVRKAYGDKYLDTVSFPKGVHIFNMRPNYDFNGDSLSDARLDSLDKGSFYYTDTKWEIVCRENIKKLSAIAFFFAKELQKNLKESQQEDVPIGIVINSIGGSNTESWMSREEMEKDDRLVHIYKDWHHNGFVMDWIREKVLRDFTGRELEFQGHPYMPNYLFYTGILPVKDFNVKGVLWYQGESNAFNPDIHRREFKGVVASFRSAWGKSPKEMPFYYAQLSSLERPDWALFRNSQRLILEEVKNSSMVVISDLGDRDNVHPGRKREVGERFAHSVLANTYNITQDWGFPLFKSVVFTNGEKGEAEVLFDNGVGLKSSDGKPLREFEIAGEDGVFFDAEAKIEGDRVIVASLKVKQPRYVRYAWKPYSEGNLVNKYSLPASTFVSELK